VDETEFSPTIFQAEYFDGTSALSYQVRVRVDGNQLLITDGAADRLALSWKLGEIRWISGTEKPVFSTSATPDARLILQSADLAHQLARHYPSLKGRIETVKSRKTHGMAWKFGVAAVLLTVGLLAAVPWLSGPLARMAPEAWRESLGRQASETIESLLGERCHGAAGQAVLDDLARRLTAELPVPEGVTMRAINSSMINAFALPGGHVHVMRGLIAQAESGDEVAGVVAHEIAHVALRHPEELTFRQLGYQVLLSTVADSGAVTELAATAGIHLVNSAYSREAESYADRLAFELLSRANMSRRGIHAFFERIQKLEFEGPEILKYLSSHPATGERKLAAQASIGDGKPALSDTDWNALRRICD